MKGARLSLVVAFTCQAVVMGDLVACLISLPPVARDLAPRGGVAAYPEWVLVAYTTPLVVILLLHKRILRAENVRGVLASALAMFAIAAAVAMATFSWPLLLAARGLAGGSAALMVTGSLALLAPRINGRQSGAVAVWGAAAVLGAIIMGGAARELMAAVGWRVLLAPGLVLAPAFAILAAATPRQPRTSARYLVQQAETEDAVLVPRAVMNDLRQALEHLADGAEQALSAPGLPQVTAPMRRTILSAHPDQPERIGRS
ncbi:MFS transporter [Streptosporangiaceae bacterium NEAU-GS5]|nr:MFS transporter [Streptosporangiaceae bacterium NEAU-GS5]